MPLHKLSVKEFRPDRIFKKLYQIAQFCKRYHSPLTFKYYLSLLYYLHLQIRKGFRQDEIFSLGLLSSSPSDKKSNKYISHLEFNKTLRTLNPIHLWVMVSANKGIFYMDCKNLNLPIPELYAILFRDFLSVSFRNSSLLKRDNLIEFIKNELPSEFCIKPTTGTGGIFVNTYTKTDDGIIDGFGEFKTEQAIYENIMNNKRYDSFIVQERLKNHPYLSKIHLSENLHTLRIITLVNSSGQCRILHGHINIATGQEIASQHGSLKISISLNDGSLEYGVFIDKKNGGFKKVNEHPETGQDFREFKLPLWEQVISLSKEAALKFLPLRTLGWDIAITEKGVLILETNTLYLPPYYFRPMDRFIDTLLNA